MNQKCPILLLASLLRVLTVLVLQLALDFFYDAKLNDGTGRSLTLLISNKHVFKDSTHRLTMSLNRKRQDGTPHYGNVITFAQENFVETYYEHPDPSIDLACVNASQISHTDAFYRTLNDPFLDEIDFSKVMPSNDVIFIGYPENRFDIHNNLPLVRKGSIASLPSIDFNGKGGQVVIDAQVFQGSSGSPVFVAYGRRYYLLGVISETMIKHSQLQTLPANIQQIGVQQILGLGLAIKQRHVKELIEYSVEEFKRRNP